MIDKLNNNEIKPSQITKPIQLLSAWLVGLILTNGSFLTAAALLGSDDDASNWLVYASIFNVPLFIISIFLLQTKFRPEMQEDVFYSQYLDKKSNKIIEVNRIDVIEKQLKEISEAVRDRQKVKTSSRPFRRLRVAINDFLPNITEIKKFVRRNGHIISDTFGSGHSKELPKLVVISFNEYLDFELVKPFIKDAHSLGITNISVFNPMEEPENHDVYIGSYGSTGIPITYEFLSSIEKIDMTDLVFLVRAAENPD